MKKLTPEQTKRRLIGIEPKAVVSLNTESKEKPLTFVGRLLASRVNEAAKQLFDSLPILRLNRPQHLKM